MLGFIGGGAMAEALIKGILTAKLSSADQVIVYDVDEDRLSYLNETLNIRQAQSNRQIVQEASLIVLAVKPQVAAAALQDLKDHWREDHLVVSIMAGITLDFLDDHARPARLIRVMPNTPCLVQAGAAGMAKGPRADDSDLVRVGDLLRTVSHTVVVDEVALDAVTGLSGSAPAYVYMFIEALADGGVLAGLPRPLALTLAAQTVFGAAKMVLETGQHPGLLKDMVASPAGTTIAGIEALERGAFRGLVMGAVQAGAVRSVDFGKAGE